MTSGLQELSHAAHENYGRNPAAISYLENRQGFLPKAVYSVPVYS
jgi:hypothetical protein